jgi:hypothetical protein
MEMKTGQRVYLKERGKGSRTAYTVEYVGPHTVRLRRADGVIVVVKRRKLAAKHALKAYPKAAMPRIILTPMGGQPRSRKTT